MKEDAFGDNLAVGWRKPSDGNSSSPTEVIPGDVLSASLTNSASNFRAYVESNVSLVLSPVPVSNTLNIKFFFVNDSDNSVGLAIYDYTGRLAISRFLTEDTFNGEIDVSRLAPGVYILSLTKANEVITKRFTVRQ
jgi:hypothetical protein